MELVSGQAGIATADARIHRRDGLRVLSQCRRIAGRVLRLRLLPMPGMRPPLLRARVCFRALALGGSVAAQSRGADPGVPALLYGKEGAGFGSDWQPGALRSALGFFLYAAQRPLRCGVDRK